MNALLRDVRSAMRTMRRDSGLTIFAVLTIGLGVGASTIVFSVAGALLLRPLPFEEPSRLVWVANGESTNLSAQTVQVDNLRDYRERNRTMVDVAGFFAFYGVGDLRVNGPQGPQRLTGVPVTENFFPLLGVGLTLGRNFTPEEVRSGDGVILGHRLWRQRFQSDPEVLGSRMIVSGTPTTIVGVLPERFDFQAIFTPGKPADLFTPYALSPEHNRQGNTLALVGRLGSDAELGSAQAEATLIAQQIDQEQTDNNRNDFEPRLTSLRERVSGGVRQSLLVLSVAVGFLMLIVCANLSNLLLARATTRRKEMALHMALGAGRSRLLRRLLVESLMLSLLGAALGLVLAVFGTGLFAQIEGTSVPLLNDVRVDKAALAFTTLLAVVTGLIFGLTPALRASDTSPATALAEGARTTAGRQDRWMRNALVVSEVALACVLLVGVGLLLRSFLRVLDTDLGFETENLVALRIDTEGEFEQAQRIAYYDQLLDVVRALPGVEGAGLTDALPLGTNFGWRVWDTRAATSEEVVSPLVRVVDEGYLATMGVQLTRGRFFESSDTNDGDLVVVVNQTLARTLWPDQEAVDQTLRTSGREYRVVGVVGEVRYFALERESGAEMYFAIRQMRSTNSMDLVVRTPGPPDGLLPMLRERLNAVDPTLPTEDFRTMQELVSRSTFSRRSVLVLLASFAGFGLILASLGIYSVVSYAVGRRRREMGVRMAFGATGVTLGRSVMQQTLSPVLIGIAVGALASWLLGRTLSSMLYGISTTDPLTYAAVFALLTLSAVFASYFPARRTARMNVIDALRAE